MKIDLFLFLFYICFSC